jgi:rhamnose utilization protein RhaD (predicted bifunctional aldolase and dehydrogenase)
MKSAWVEREAKAAVDHFGKAGIGADLALRVYSTRLIGADPKLVLHGGGNTSVKTRARDLMGAEVDVLCVKGSGWDMGTIAPPGLPAVRLAPLKTLRSRNTLSDADMVKLQRANLIDPASPNPSVETLLHAFLPHKFVDHTHSTAVLGIVDQPNSRELCEEIYDGRMGFVRYIMPGFGLAKEAADVFEQAPKVEGLILDKHGIFTFGDSAREAYERMIEMVTLAEARLKKNRKAVFATAQLPQAAGTVAEIAPILRGAVALKDEKHEGAWKRLVLDFRANGAILNFVNGVDIARYSQAGVITPDHTIRTKDWPLIAPAPDGARLDDFRGGARAGSR